MLVKLKCNKFLAKGEQGMSLIEILVALAILAIAGIAFISGMAMLFQGVRVSQKSVAMESLAKSEMEYVKSLDYNDQTNAPWDYTLPSNPPIWDTDHTLPAGYDGYTVQVESKLLPGHISDDGIQQIKITVKGTMTYIFWDDDINDGNRVKDRELVLSGYKRK